MASYTNLINCPNCGMLRATELVNCNGIQREAISRDCSHCGFHQDVEEENTVAIRSLYATYVAEGIEPFAACVKATYAFGDSMNTTHSLLFDAIRCGDVVTTNAGRAATDNGLFWAGWSIPDAVEAGFVEYSPEQQKKVNALREDFVKATGHEEPADGDYSD